MAKRQPRAPGKFIRSKLGAVARVAKTRNRDADGRWLYRLYFLPHNTPSGCLWTLDDLNAEGVRWYKRKPRNLKRT